MSERKFREKITIGVIKKMGMTIGELANLKDLSTLKIDQLVALINGMMIEGEKVNDDMDIQELFALMKPMTESFLAGSRREKTT